MKKKERKKERKKKKKEKKLADEKPISKTWKKVYFLSRKKFNLNDVTRTFCLLGSD